MSTSETHADLTKRLRGWAFAVSVVLVGACTDSPLSTPAPNTESAATVLERVRDLDEGESFTAYLVRYRHAGLNLYAMVAVPKSPPPPSGYPVVVANHGYVPEPARYGITSDGRDSRPGDYYRPLPELYASRGFMVVIADYRGHNASDGAEFVITQDNRAMRYYAEDVLALVSRLESLAQINPDALLLWSHSMGGRVSLHVLAAAPVFKAASFWATMPLEDLQGELEQLRIPVVIHHAVDDPATSHRNSVWLHAQRSEMGFKSERYDYDGSEHFLTPQQRELAADRDARFFRAALAVRSLDDR